MRWVVTGAAGFIGTNLSEELARLKQEVCLIDDLSRPGVSENVKHLKEQFDLDINIIDISNWEELQRTLLKFGSIDIFIHLAGQVSLMSSITNPRRDFEVNALGTLNILEFARIYAQNAIIVGMSSNKVYGDLGNVLIEESTTRYIAPNYPNGFNELLPLDFQGPYGCSKGSADQYLIDYHRIYNLKTLSLRQSSVFGRFQRPFSDQGWISFFLDQARNGQKVQLNGIGKQVRDALFVNDLVQLFISISKMPEKNFGFGVNVGGGASNAISILELFQALEEILSVKIDYSFGQERPSDQKVFISDNSLIQSLSGWQPATNYRAGLELLISELV